jgi:hypothetical protein
VIANRREYQITLEEAARFEEALAHVEEENPELSPRLRQAMRESLQSQLDELRAQLAEYDERTRPADRAHPASAQPAARVRRAARRA